MFTKSQDNQTQVSLYSIVRLSLTKNVSTKSVEVLIYNQLIAVVQLVNVVVHTTVPFFLTVKVAVQEVVVFALTLNSALVPVAYGLNLNNNPVGTSQGKFASIQFQPLNEAPPVGIAFISSSTYFFVAIDKSTVGAVVNGTPVKVGLARLAFKFKAV